MDKIGAKKLYELIAGAADWDYPSGHTVDFKHAYCCEGAHRVYTPNGHCFEVIYWGENDTDHPDKYEFYNCKPFKPITLAGAYKVAKQLKKQAESEDNSAANL